MHGLVEMVFYEDSLINARKLNAKIAKLRLSLGNMRFGKE